MDIEENQFELLVKQLSEKAESEGMRINKLAKYYFISPGKKKKLRLITMIMNKYPYTDMLGALWFIGYSSKEFSVPDWVYAPRTEEQVKMFQFLKDFGFQDKISGLSESTDNFLTGIHTYFQEKEFGDILWQKIKESDLDPRVPLSDYHLSELSVYIQALEGILRCRSDHGEDYSYLKRKYEEKESPGTYHFITKIEGIFFSELERVIKEKYEKHFGVEPIINIKKKDFKLPKT